MRCEPAEARVLRQLIEALAFEGLIAPAPGGWEVAGLAIRAPYRTGGFGRVRLLGEAQGADGLPLRLPELLAALAAAGFDTALLGTALGRTAHFLRAAGPVRRNRLLLRGAALDGALIEGHPYHPCFKSRIGFSDADNAAFGPEAGQGFRALWLAADPALVTATGTPLAEGSGMQAPPGRVLMPVHPWQWRHLARDPAVAAWLAEGRLRLLGEGGPLMRATQSLRTLAPMAPGGDLGSDQGGDHLKLSLAVGITSSVRDIAPWSVAVAPAISGWLGRVVAEDPAFARWPLTILPEHGAAILGRDWLGGRLAALRRSPPPEGAVPVNALTLADPDGTPLIAPWLARHGVMRWVSRLLEVLVLPVWHLMGAHGIGLEAHGQNLLITHDEGWPTGLVARDFHESLEYVPGLLARPELLPDLAAIDPGFAHAADGTYHRMGAASDLRDLVLDCLGVHVLADLAHLLHRQGWLPEAQFWAACRAILPEGAKPALGLHAPLLPAERLAGRVLGARPESHPVPNPLADRPLMPEFFIDSTRVDPQALDLPDLLGGADPSRARIALHISDKAACLAQILRLRGAGASVYPIHPETPAEQALDLARRAGCTRLAGDQGVLDLQAMAPDCPGGVLIQMSSGTTGAPKVIARSWAAIETEIAAYLQAFPEGAEHSPVIAAPITHSYGLIAGALVGMARGKAPVILDSANPLKILRQLAGIEAPLLYAAPALLHALARLAGPGKLPAAVMSSGTVLPQPWFDTIKAAARGVYQQYGCSEAGCLSLTTAPNAPEDMGLPLPHLRLLAGSSAPAPVRVEGEGGALDTGDLGVIDGRGHLIFAGRAAEVIDVAGINVYPAEIERVALACPGVSDAVAFALPDATAHQRPGLAFTGTASVAALEVHLAAGLSPRQRPLRLFAVEAMPRGPGGKVSRRELAARFAPEGVA
ncbi:MAG: AMP-binding protein [Gemmobacter sp.]|uniref:IucA/IucC family protein n=1 Tax=Gemmobacter sp. TaxID=1898957 RepID=UPI001A3FE4AE|nr:IucA/IucC family protein [Gemmobacter sp.]MBL8561906.1 AMP-binding protein [Gemmobacter sp.]